MKKIWFTASLPKCVGYVVETTKKKGWPQVRAQGQYSPSDARQRVYLESWWDFIKRNRVGWVCLKLTAFNIITVLYESNPKFWGILDELYIFFCLFNVFRNSNSIWMNVFILAWLADPLELQSPTVKTKGNFFFNVYEYVCFHTGRLWSCTVAAYILNQTKLCQAKWKQMQ